jgi:hypothetical protein
MLPAGRFCCVGSTVSVAMSMMWRVLSRSAMQLPPPRSRRLVSSCAHGCPSSAGEGRSDRRGSDRRRLRGSTAVYDHADTVVAGIFNIHPESTDWPLTPHQTSPTSLTLMMTWTALPAEHGNPGVGNMSTTQSPCYEGSPRTSLQTTTAPRFPGTSRCSKFVTPNGSA